jgi:hypothetical protein
MPRSLTPSTTSPPLPPLPSPFHRLYAALHSFPSSPCSPFLRYQLRHGACWLAALSHCDTPSSGRGHTWSCFGVAVMLRLGVTHRPPLHLWQPALRRHDAGSESVLSIRCSQPLSWHAAAVTCEP